MMRTLFWLLAGLSVQTTNFEVASIRPSSAAPGAGTSVNLFEGGRIRITNEPAKLLIRFAFRLQDAQIIGGPNWLDQDRFDIEAKTGRSQKPTAEEFEPMFQALLTDRFGLQFHRETKELTVGALVVAKGGPKLTLSREELGSSSTNGGSKKLDLVATGTSMALLASYVGNRLNRIVVDRTGLSGSYDFKLEWAPDGEVDSPAPPLVSALQDQLGLRIEAQKAQVEVLVIERITRPTEN
jgi:uncharacterized protein (TIGR03435 family)